MFEAVFLFPGSIFLSFSRLFPISDRPNFLSAQATLTSPIQDDVHLAGVSVSAVDGERQKQYPLSAESDLQNGRQAIA